MRRLSWAVLGSTFTMVAAVSLGHAQSAGSMRPPAWAKFCENVTVASKDTDGFEEKKAVRVCMTFHERISGKDGTAIVGAVLREIDGQDEKHLLVAMPLDTQVQHAQLFPRDVWDTLQRAGKLDKSEEPSIKDLKFGSTLCNAIACIAETEVTPALISDLEVSGGLMVFATNPSGMTIARPIPLIDFAQALAGPPVEPGARARPDGPILCDGAEWRGCSMKPIRQGKR
jgi:invasion protein IalB